MHPIHTQGIYYNKHNIRFPYTRHIKYFICMTTPTLSKYF